MSGQADLNIRTFIPTDLAQVRELFVSGLMEFAGDVEREVRRYVDQSLNDDLADIPGHYLSHPRSNFGLSNPAALRLALWESLASSRGNGRRRRSCGG